MRYRKYDPFWSLKVLINFCFFFTHTPIPYIKSVFIYYDIKFTSTASCFSGTKIEVCFTNNNFNGKKSSNSKREENLFSLIPYEMMDWKKQIQIICTKYFPYATDVLDQIVIMRDLFQRWWNDLFSLIKNQLSWGYYFLLTLRIPNYCSYTHMSCQLYHLFIRKLGPMSCKCGW